MDAGNQTQTQYVLLTAEAFQPCQCGSDHTNSGTQVLTCEVGMMVKHIRPWFTLPVCPTLGVLTLCPWLNAPVGTGCLSGLPCGLL